nr:uncharacterized protein CFP56_49491 [Quercus suber]POE89722.1 uncharacterized protein CFP56_49494 [Quercus suber]
MLSTESSRSLILSTEEQEELARSNKKVKNVGHAGFQEGMDTSSSSPRRSNGRWNQSMTFKDRLMGEVPGAYTQAFSFEDLMKDDIESDDEVEALREGLVAVKFSKDLKHEMRSPWTRALIVKVYGRPVGFNFIHNKLLAMWKPAGRLDCVGLGHGFFLTRLSLKEDYENILRKGPWFIGGHFLSIRPWEPNFHLATANVSSMAVWIRLNELLIEYYNAKALHQIGKSIGNVLRVDTHTATETKGKFARLCVQIVVNKPLVTAILIGKFEQPVCYEGIQKLCFGCGRVGHQKNICPYTIRHDSSERMPEGSVPSSPCEKHAPDKAKIGQGINESVNGSVNEEASESTYGPWVVVARKRNGTRKQAAGGSPMVQVHNQPWSGPVLNGSGSTNDVGNVQPSHNAGLGKEVKCRLSATRDINGPLLANSLQRLGKMSNSWDKKEVVGSLVNVGVEKVMGQTGFGKDKQVPKPNRSTPNQSDSVKGKKELARARAFKVNSPCAVRAAEEKILSLNHQSQDQIAQIGDGNQQSRTSSDFQFTAATCLEAGFKVEGRDRRSISELKQGRSGMGFSKTELSDSDTMQSESIGVLSRVEDVSTNSEHHELIGVQTHGNSDTNLLISYTGQSSSGCLRDGMRDDAGVVGADRMDFEGEGKVVADL